MQKPLSDICNFLLKLAFFSGSYVYVQLFHLNSNKNNLFIAIKVFESALLDCILKLAVIPLACAPFPTQILPSSQLCI